MSISIGTVDLPGGARLGLCGLPGRRGDALADLEALAAWQPAMVLSMTEVAEMERHNVGDLGGLLSRHGIDWLHLPIRDFGTPREDWTKDWPAISKRLHGILDQGGGIIAHCYGGQGRSGMVCLRLMVERGFGADEALAQIRAVVPGAVETEEQFEWARAAQPIQPPQG